MSGGSFAIRAETGDEWFRMARALREVDAKLPSELRKEMRKAVDDTVKKVKAEARSIPVVRNDPRNKGLRRMLARGVQVRAGTGRNSGTSYLRIITQVPQVDMAIIPRGTDVVKHPNPGWRHPVFERHVRKRRLLKKNKKLKSKTPWVRQRTGKAWFREPIAADRDDIKDNLVDVLDWARDRLVRAGGRSPL